VLSSLLAYHKEGEVEAGCDEAGRGCLAGPVCAAAVILPATYTSNILNDSKQLTEQQRNKLRIDIENKALAYGVAFVDNNIIDALNIYRATYLAMHYAIEKLSVLPSRLLIDGNRFIPFKQIPYHCIVKGDSLFYSIAAASVLAKTYRDEYMKQLHSDYPHYCWDKNKGYATKNHIEAIKNYGRSQFHRKSFKLKVEQQKLNFKES
jgi:ribonuclease HII